MKRGITRRYTQQKSKTVLIDRKIGNRSKKRLFHVCSSLYASVRTSFGSVDGAHTKKELKTRADFFCHSIYKRIKSTVGRKMATLEYLSLCLRKNLRYQGIGNGLLLHLRCNYQLTDFFFLHNPFTHLSRPVSFFVMIENTITNTRY